MRTGTVLDLFLSKQKVLGFSVCVNLRRTVGTLPSINLCRCSEFRAGGLQQPQDTGETPLTQTSHSEIKRTCKHFRALFQGVLVRVRHTGGEKLAIIVTRGKIWQHDTMIFIRLLILAVFNVWRGLLFLMMWNFMWSA